MYDYLYTKTRQKLDRSFTEASQKLTEALENFWTTAPSEQ